MHWSEIENGLAQRPEDVCRLLFPSGKREGAEFVIGNLDGAEGHSLKVNLAGKVGLWRDFAGDTGGKTLLSLWLHARALGTFGEAVRQAKEFLGIHDDQYQRIKAAYPEQLNKFMGAPSPRPSPPGEGEESTWKQLADIWAQCQPLTEEGPVWNYLVYKRGLDAQVLQVFDVREYVTRGQWAIVFPYYATPVIEDVAQVKLPGEVEKPAWLKFELLDRPGGKKKEWTSRNPEKSLFGAHLLKHPAFKKCRHLLICEGEKDALTWASYGCGAWGVLPVSVPFGAKYKGQEKHRPSPNREWIDRSWDFMEEFESILVSMDQRNLKKDGTWDDTGPRAAVDIIQEIGPRRCRLVTLPEKEEAA